MVQSRSLFKGAFNDSPDYIKKTLTWIKALVFDWDGVFNDGNKSSLVNSGFSEVDSMGINLLRFAFWLRDEGNLPIAAVISGARNETAHAYAQREHFHHVYTGVRQKDLVVKDLCEVYNIAPDNIAFFFDDIIDLSAAKLVGLKFFFSNPSAPVTAQLIKSERLFDYIANAKPGEGAIREVCELVLSEMGLYEKVVEYRIAYHGEYEKYLLQRNEVATNIHKY